MMLLLLLLLLLRSSDLLEDDVELVKRSWFLVVNVIAFAGLSTLLLEPARRSMARGLNILRILYRGCLLSGWEMISFGYISRYRILLKREDYEYTGVPLRSPYQNLVSSASWNGGIWCMRHLSEQYFYLRRLDHHHPLFQSRGHIAPTVHMLFVCHNSD